MTRQPKTQTAAATPVLPAPATAVHPGASRRARRRRIAVWSAALLVVGALLLPLVGYLAVSRASAAPAQSAADGQQANPRANYWRAVRQGSEGYTAASGPYTTNVLMQNGGENWRNVRNGPLAGIAPWFLAGVALAIGLFYILRGRIRLERRPSGATVERWTLPERVLHWYTATLFILLTLTGLSLLFGRAVLIPVLGLDGFAAYATLAIAVHNYLGPFFTVGVLLEIVAWIRFNIPNRIDWEWFRQGGGFVGHSHPSAGRANGGEKLWFWLLATVGVGVCVTGLILDFPNFEQTRQTMQLSNLVHSVFAMLWIAVALGHIYIGTVGTEGALEGMTTGRVSVEWAKQHHDLWYEEAARKGEQPKGKSARAATRPASS